MPYRRIHLTCVDSTNAFLLEGIKLGKFKDEVVLTADYQEKGRGQGDHQWESSPGENLLLSVLLFPAFLSASRQFHLSRVTSLAISDTLVFTGLKPLIKWPNDLLVNRRKIAGILIENGITGQYLSHSILGIGLNLNQDEFPEFQIPATSVALETGIPADRDRLADTLLGALETRYNQLRSGAVRVLEEDYLEQMYLLGEQAEFVSGGRRFKGTIRGVDRHGELLIEQEGTTRSYGFQQIQYESARGNKKSEIE